MGEPTSSKDPQPNINKHRATSCSREPNNSSVRRLTTKAVGIVPLHARELSWPAWQATIHGSPLLLVEFARRRPPMFTAGHAGSIVWGSGGRPVLKNLMSFSRQTIFSLSNFPE